MTDASDQPIVWRDGVLIAPQHLQRQDLGHRAALHARLSALSPYAWGVVHLRLDDDALRRGLVRLVELRAILPDGTPIDVRAEGVGCPPARAIGEVMPPSARALDVAVALPELRDGLENYGGGPEARYRLGVRAGVVDLAGGRSRVDLEVAEPNLALALGEELRESGRVTLKLAEVARGADGSLSYAADYAPPCLHFAAARGLCAALRELLAVAIAKRRALVELRRERAGSAAEFLGRDITHYLLLDALSAGIPLLRHALDTPGTSPLAAHLALVEFAGRLSAFATEVDPAAFPAFDHLDLRGSFEPLLRDVRAMLGIAVREGFIRAPLALRPEDGMWLGRLADDALRRCPVHLVVVESSLPAAEVAELVPRLAKVASWARITGHIKQATPGARLLHLPSPPPEIPARPRHLYFAIAEGDPDWRHVLADRNVAVYLPEPFDARQLRVEVVGILAPADAAEGGR